MNKPLARAAALRVGLVLATVACPAIGMSWGCRQPPPAASTVPFVVATPYVLTSLDPHVANTLSNYSILSNVYEPLVTTDADLRVQPALALSWENPDPLTWVLRLRPGVTFHRGRTLDAGDVVYSLDRLRTDPRLKMRAFIQTLTEVQALDKLTVRLRTSRPNRVLLSKLHFAAIVPSGSTTESLEKAPDGTGPYALVDWQRGGAATLRRHGGYWGRPGHLGEVTFAMGLSRGEAVKGILARRFQLVQDNNLSLEDRLLGSPDHDVVRRDNIYTKYLGYDLGRDQTPYCAVRPNPFRDLRVRRALNAALDRRALASGLPVQARPANQPVPHFIFGFNPALPMPGPDLEAARRLLKEAGLGAGFEVVLHSRTMFAEAAQAVQSQWARVRVKVTLALLTDEEYFPRQDRYDQTLWLTRYGCPTGDASDFLDAVVHSRDDARNYGTQNHAQMVDPELDRMIERAAEVAEGDEHRQAVQEAMAATMERLVVLPLYFDQDVYAYDREYVWRPRNDSYIRVTEVAPRERSR